MDASNLNGAALAIYTYNGLERRPMKVGAMTTDLLYDRVGRLLAEANKAKGVMIRNHGLTQGGGASNFSAAGNP